VDAFITSKSSPVLLSWHVLSTIGFDLCSGCTSTPKKSVFILQLLIRSGFVRKIHGLAIKVYEFWWRLLWRGSGNSAEGQQAYWNMLGPLRWGSSRIISYDDILTKIDLCVSRGTLQQPFSFLDCGGGDGRLSLAITARYQISSSTLVDCSDYMVERARMNLPQSTIVRCEYGPGCQVQGTWDLVVARSTLTYVSQDHIVPVCEWLASRALKMLVISEPIEYFGEQICHGLQRRYDKSYVRNYERYFLGDKFSLVIGQKDVIQPGNYTWVFERVAS